MPHKPKVTTDPQTALPSIPKELIGSVREGTHDG